MKHTTKGISWSFNLANNVIYQISFEIIEYFLAGRDGILFFSAYEPGHMHEKRLKAKI